MAPSQCLGHNTSRYEACNVARIGNSRRDLADLADWAFRHGFGPRAPLGKAAAESLLELGEKKHTLSCCARRNLNKLAEGLTFLRLEAGRISPGGVGKVRMDWNVALRSCSPKKSPCGHLKFNASRKSLAFKLGIQAWQG